MTNRKQPLRTAKTIESKPCRKCGSTTRYASNGNCCDCVRAASNHWYHTNKERARKYQDEWRERNKPAVAATQKRWCDKNRQHYREYQKDYHTEYRKENRAAIALNNLKCYYKRQGREIPDAAMKRWEKKYNG